MTPEQIETILSEFRDWLRVSAPPPDAPLPPEPVDLHTLVAQFTALRQEVNLQTRAVRQQQEQNAETLRQLEAALNRPTASPSTDEPIKPLLNALIDISDTQLRAAAELGRVAQTIKAVLDAEVKRGEQSKPSFLARLMGGRLPEPAVDPQTLDRLGDTIDAAVAGLEMGQQRIERTMQKQGLEAIAAVGQPFDPELMEAVEVEADSGRPGGEVVGELRRGYRWNGRVLRYAQVRVAK